MIRINLLPIRQARKRESVKQQLILGAVLLVGALVGLYLWYNTMENKLDDKKRQIKQTEQQIEQYKKAIGEVEKYKGLEEALDQKLKIIESLVKGKSGPVRVLDKLSQLIPKQVWLLEWAETPSGELTLTGEALSNKYVAQFMTLLKESSTQVVPPAPTAAIPVAPTPAPDKGAKAGATKGAQAHKSYFSNIRLIEAKATDADKAGKSGKTFVKFKIQLKVNYTI